MLSEPCLSRFSKTTGNKAAARLCRASWIGCLNLRGGALDECRLRYFAQDDELLMRIFCAQAHDLAMCLFERHHRCNRTSGRITTRRLATKNCKLCDHRATCLILSSPGSIRSYAGAHHMPSTLPRWAATRRQLLVLAQTATGLRARWQIRQAIQAGTAAAIPTTEALCATLTTARRFGCDKCGTKYYACDECVTPAQRETIAIRLRTEARAALVSIVDNAKCSAD